MRHLFSPLHMSIPIRLGETVIVFVQEGEFVQSLEIRNDLGRMSCLQLEIGPSPRKNRSEGTFNNAQLMTWHKQALEDLACLPGMQLRESGEDVGNPPKKKDDG